MDPERPAKPISRPRGTLKRRKQRHNIDKNSQQTGLLFVNVSDPTESKRQDSRKAVRSFVMKKYKQSQRSFESSQLEQMEVEEEIEDVVEKSLEVMQVGNSNDSPSQLWPEKGCGVEEFEIEPGQQTFLLPTLAPTGQINSPMSLLGSGSLDPFDSYPVQIDLRGHKLVDLYLNTDSVFPETPAFNRDRRRKTWFPLICSSKANFHGLLMSAAMACSIKDISQFEPMILTNYQNTIEALNREIRSNQDLPNANSNIFTIKTLLLVAMHQKDTHAVRMHFQGAVAIVQKYGSPYRMDRLAQKIIASFVCWTSFAPPDTLLVPFAELVSSSSLYSDEEENSTTQESRSGSYSSAVVNIPPISHPGLRRPHAHDEFTNNDTADIRTSKNNFKSRLSPLQDSFYQRRTLPPALRKATHHITALSFLARRARRSSLSHQDLAQLMAGICCGGQRLASINAQSLSPLEDCIRMTTLVHYFADIVPFEDGDEPRIAHLTDGVQAQLSILDLGVLLQEWPEVMLWIAIIVGVFAKAETWIYFQDLLRLTCGHLKILRWSGVVDIINGFQPISSEPFLGCCEAFWLSSRTLKSVKLEGGQIRRHSYVTEEI